MTVSCLSDQTWSLMEIGSLHFHSISLALAIEIQRTNSKNEPKKKHQWISTEQTNDNEQPGKQKKCAQHFFVSFQNVWIHLNTVTFSISWLIMILNGSSQQNWAEIRIWFFFFFCSSATFLFAFRFCFFFFVCSVKSKSAEGMKWILCFFFCPFHVKKDENKN